MNYIKTYLNIKASVTGIVIPGALMKRVTESVLGGQNVKPLSEGLHYVISATNDIASEDSFIDSIINYINHLLSAY